MNQTELLYPGSLTEKGHWEVLLASGTRNVLFSCRVCGMINLVGNLTVVAESGQLPHDVCCRGCRWQGSVVLAGWE